MSDDIIAMAEIGNMRVTVFYDENADDPREYSDCLGIMACFHKSYRIGDHLHEKEDPFEFQKWVTTSKDVAVWLPIYMLDHSGLTIRTYPFDDPWDSGLLGFIYTTKEAIRRWYGKKRISQKLLEEVRESLLEDVREMDCYLRGDVYCVTLEKGDDIIDTTCGIYGYDSLKEVLTNELPEEFKPVVEKLDL